MSALVIYFLIKTITSHKSHSTFVTIPKKVSESIVISSYEQNKNKVKNTYDKWFYRLDLNNLKLISEQALSKDHW